MRLSITKNQFRASSWTPSRSYSRPTSSVSAAKMRHRALDHRETFTSTPSTFVEHGDSRKMLSKTYRGLSMRSVLSKG
jgi:hypothetical protein